ncbi:hypothetical protein BDN71DRAFT_1529516 [Pleurotus eryngii]|uniref:Uncharacterized protein n=1 Tax=Pleurotus eryngii TaxID=5323 RepID=A0A9P6DB71_PLEER|nr:hypothetical protein BDN71DRAFT_1529516 [Pleurotus eryngii]
MKRYERPPKASKKNISGLRNQPRALASDSSQSVSRNASPASIPNSVPESDLRDQVHFESLRVTWEDEEQEWYSNDDDGDIEDADDIWDHEDLTPGIVEMIEMKEEQDGEWLPSHLRWASLRKTARPTEYMKGPDVMSKSKRTQRRHRKANIGQTKLNTYLGIGDGIAALANEISDKTFVSDVERSVPNSTIVSDEGSEIEHNHDSDVEPDLAYIREIEVEIEGADELNEEDGEAWEDKLEENICNPQMEIRLWDVLQKQISKSLKNRTLPWHSRIEASHLIALICKGGEGEWFAHRIRELARHYQIFEDLPTEQRSGSRIGRSWIHHEGVHPQVRDFLKSLPAGKVTPQALVKHINDVIFPELSITPKKPLSERTGQHWLLKMEWRHSLVRKGVYMDGHERADVVKYRDEEFLPLMKKYEEHMTHYEGPELTRQPPTLPPGTREMIAMFHDESCFHANDNDRKAWLSLGQQPLHSKSQGQLIHVSDFINSETGQLVLKDKDGNITHDAQTIIYPSANSKDEWWDTKQLLVQMQKAIDIFNKAHPGKQALFIFDQSSAHASLPDDALKAFEMNKSDGGKQRVQRDTIILESNPTPEYQGQKQAMTLPNGEQKGLKHTLEEHGFNVHSLRAKCSPVCPIDSENCCMARLLSQQDDFKNQPSMLKTLIHAARHKVIFLPKFHCKLNPIEMYWGWCKYCYRQADKKSFQQAKEAAELYLNACPVEVIRRFVNRSWRFMSAYRCGLTGRVAEWAVRKQKGHHTVSGLAMLAIESLVHH